MEDPRRDRNHINIELELHAILLQDGTTEGSTQDKSLQCMQQRYTFRQHETPHAHTQGYSDHD